MYLNIAKIKSYIFRNKNISIFNRTRDFIQEKLSSNWFTIFILAQRKALSHLLDNIILTSSG